MITAIGSGEARPATRSHGPSGRSRVEQAVDHLLDPRAVLADGMGVKAGATSRRSRCDRAGLARAATADRPPAEPATLDTYAEASVPEHLSAHVVTRGLVADQGAADQRTTSANLLVEVVRIANTLGKVEPRQRVPSDARVPDRHRAHHDELTRQRHDGVHMGLPGRRGPPATPH